MKPTSSAGAGFSSEMRCSRRVWGAVHFQGFSPARLALAVWFLLLSSSAVFGQNVQFTQGGGGSSLDNAIQIPITSYPGRGGASLPITLYYSSKVWRVGYIKTVHVGALPQSVAEAIYSEYATAGWTTSLDLPTVQWPKQDDLYWYDGKSYHFNIQPYTYRIPNVYIHMPDGATHELRRSDEPYQNLGSVSMTGVFYAVDGSRMRYDADAGMLYLPDGSRYVLNGSNGKFIDRNGNTLSYNGSTREWTDTLGTVLRGGDIGMPFPANPQAGSTSNYTPPGFASPYKFVWKHLSEVLTTPDAQGNTPGVRAMSSHYLPQPSATPSDSNGNNFPQAIPAGTESLFNSAMGDESADNPALTYAYVVGRGQSSGVMFDPVVLAEVVLPNSAPGNTFSYKFSYNVYGEIDKVIYPTGAYERSQYDTIAPMGDMKPPYTQAVRGVRFRWVSPNGTGGADEAQWKYETTTFAPGYLVKTTAPDGTYTESYRLNIIDTTGKSFGHQDTTSGLAYDERVYDKDPANGGVMLRRTLTKWGQTVNANLTGPTTPCCNIPRAHYNAYRNPRPLQSVSLILDTGGAALAKLTTYQYGASDPTNAWAIELSYGLDQTGVTESFYVQNVDQTTAQTATLDTLISTYSFPAANSYQTTYVPSQSYRDRHILGLVASVVLHDAAGNPVSKSETFYDETAFPLLTYTDLGGDDNYSDPGGSTVRGNPTTVRRYVDLAAGTYIETHAQYDQCGNPVHFWNERAVSPFTELNATSKKDYSADYKHAYLTQTTTIAPDPSGLNGSTAQFASRSTYDPTTGQVQTMTDVNGHTTTLSYKDDLNNRDPLNRLRKITRPDGGWTKTEYHDVVGDTYVHTQTQIDATTITHSYRFADRLGREVRALASEGGSNYIATDTQYDQMGRVLRVSNSYRTQSLNGASQATAWTANTYDPLGRVEQVTLPDLSIVTTEYKGVYVTVTDQAGRQRRQKTDSLGRIVRVDEPGAGGTLGAFDSPAQPSFYEYDALGNVVRINQGLTQPNLNPESAANYTQHRYFKYDAMSRLTYEKQAEQEGTIFTAPDPLTANSAWSRRLAYDETVDNTNYKGLLTSVEDARHVVTRFSYDRLNRQYLVSYTDGTPTLTSKYDQPGTDPVTNLDYANKGRLTEVTTAATSSLPQTQQLYDYDQTGKIVRQRQSVDTNTYTLAYAYNLGGALVAQTYPSGKVVTYGYDAAARLSSVASGATNYASAMTYKPFGDLASMQLGNGMTYTLAYNEARSQLLSMRLTLGAVTVQQYEYKYGAVNLLDGTVDETKNNGQIARIEGTIGTQKQWQQRFQYDSLGRLSAAAEYRADNNVRSYLLNYKYDAYGNRYQKQQDNQGNSVVQSWVEENDYSSTTNRFNAGLTYDLAGNVVTDSRFRMRKFEYDANNRQKQSSNLNDTGAVTNVYDGTGQRVAVQAGGQLTNVMVYDVVGQLVAEYGASVTSSGTSYVMADHQGSTRAVMSGNAVVSRHDYLPFGEDVPGTVGMRSATPGYTQSDGVRRKYAGMERDDATGMGHTLWRKFDNMSARWTSPDPYGGSMIATSPQSFNRYAYVNNDPVNKVDPTGLMLADIGVVQTDNPAVARRLENACVTYFRRYLDGQTGRAQQQRRQERLNANFTNNMAAGFRERTLNRALPPLDFSNSSSSAASSGGGQAQTNARSEISATSQQFKEMLDEVESRLRANSGAAWMFSKYPPPFAAELETPEMRSKMLEDVIADFRATVFELEEGRNVLTLGGKVYIMAAFTDPDDKSIHVYQKGPAFDMNQINPFTHKPIPITLGKGLTQVQYGAFVVLHEYGHKSGRFGEDGGNFKRNAEHSQTILDLFFPGAKR